MDRPEFIRLDAWLDGAKKTVKAEITIKDLRLGGASVLIESEAGSQIANVLGEKNVSAVALSAGWEFSEYERTECRWVAPDGTGPARADC